MAPHPRGTLGRPPIRQSVRDGRTGREGDDQTPPVDSGTLIPAAVPEDTPSALRHVRLFEGLAPQDLRQVSHSLDIRHYRPGEFIFHMGEQADRLYFLDQGIVKVTMVSLDGRERILDVISKGNMFGESSLSDEKSRTVAAQSLNVVTVRTMSVEAFTRLMVTRPNFCLNFARHLMDLQRRTQVRLHAQMQVDRGVRLLAVLLDLGERCGQRTDDHCTLPAELTQGELAQMVGLNRSTVSVLLNFYRRIGILGGHGGVIVIHPIPARALIKQAGILPS